MSASKIGFVEAILFVLVVITNKIILNLPKTIITGCGNSAWINVIYISILAILLTLLIVKLFKKFEGYDIFDVSNYLGGKPLKIFLRNRIFVYFYTCCNISIKRFFRNFKSNILLKFSSYFYHVVFCYCYCNRK